MSAPARASSSATEPPKQKPIAAILFASTCGSEESAASAARPRAQPFRLGAQAADHGCHFLQITRLPAFAKHVGGQRDMTEFGHHARPRHDEIVQAQPFVKYHNARARRCNRFVPDQMAKQQGLAAAVIEVARLHGRCANPSNCHDPQLHIGLKQAQPRRGNSGHRSFVGSQ
jgi:hypothetical protein